MLYAIHILMAVNEGLFFLHYGVNVTRSMINVNQNKLMLLFINGVKGNIPPVWDRHFSEIRLKLKIG